ncbi:tRNA pseudouridine(55) synthase TruB [Carboxydothermus pertinax]|uniref:tRNA pseudouridine synthase B n=1 Tax=Carboxydothermus pertinax TaxID=870242 RepID=A0A1L8CX92_9THEO|nr:tRNA pseudouridine(55) synthase TruB [Carboxydothermus pertinax]GAV23494.1 tRNA pseudouridine synthase B [Carboxydothermus pertinax]
MDGFINLLKPPGMTSHDVVAFLRKKLKTKKIGHLGTLDPAAAGVLPVAVGKATRLIEYLEAGAEKQYLAEIIFGITTTTWDREGKIVAEKDASFLTEALIIEKLRHFQGEIEQTPPLASAVKIAGKPLYHYQRKGERVEVPKRKVTVYEIKLLELIAKNTPHPRARVIIRCSRGTYIRSIAYDLGNILLTGATLNFLLRTKSGPFLLKDCCLLEEELKIIPPEEVFLDYPKIELTRDQFQRVKNGGEVKLAIEKESFGQVFAYFEGKIVATGKVQGKIFLPEKVFRIGE